MSLPPRERWPKRRTPRSAPGTSGTPRRRVWRVPRAMSTGSSTGVVEGELQESCRPGGLRYLLRLACSVHHAAGQVVLDFRGVAGDFVVGRPQQVVFAV